MTEPLKHAEEKVEELVHEADEGASPRTPLLVLSGVTIFFAVAIAVLLVIAFSAYYLSK
jgi:nitrogen fixation protein FixH